MSRSDSLNRLYAPTKSSLAKSRGMVEDGREVKLGSFEEDLVASPRASRRLPSSRTSPANSPLLSSTSPFISHRSLTGSSSADESSRAHSGRNSVSRSGSSSGERARSSSRSSDSASQLQTGASSRSSSSRKAASSHESLARSQQSKLHSRSSEHTRKSNTTQSPIVDRLVSRVASRSPTSSTDGSPRESSRYSLQAARSSLSSASTSHTDEQQRRSASTRQRDRRDETSHTHSNSASRVRRSDGALETRRKERVTELADRLQGLLQLQEGSPVSVLENVARSHSQETNESEVSSSDREAGYRRDPSSSRLIPHSVSTASNVSTHCSSHRRATTASDISISELHRSQDHRQSARAAVRQAEPDLALVDSAALIEAVGAANVEGMQQDLEYVRHVLLASMFASCPAPTPPPLPDLHRPLDPSVFDRLESELAAAGGSIRGGDEGSSEGGTEGGRESSAEERRQRKLLFDAVNEALARCMLPHAPSPLRQLQHSAQRLPMQPQPVGMHLLRCVWKEIHDWPVATSEDVYDILDDAARRDMLRGNDKWSVEQVAEAEMVSVVGSIEEEVLEGLMDEVCAEWEEFERVRVLRLKEREEERARKQALKQARLQLQREQQEKEQQHAAVVHQQQLQEKQPARPTTPRHSRPNGTPSRSPMMSSNGANSLRGGGSSNGVTSSSSSRRSLDKSWLRADAKGGKVHAAP